MKKLGILFVLLTLLSCGPSNSNNSSKSDMDNDLYDDNDYSFFDDFAKVDKEYLVFALIGGILILLRKSKKSGSRNSIL